MQTRWMLWLEAGDTLDLLPGVPRAWLEAGKRIELHDVATYFGRVSLEVESQVQRNRIVARVQFGEARRPAKVRLRLPHPQSRRARSVSAGVYDPATETVCVEPSSAVVDLVLGF
jgi:hypothetical protein